MRLRESERERDQESTGTSAEITGKAAVEKASEDMSSAIWDVSCGFNFKWIYSFDS